MLRIYHPPDKIRVANTLRKRVIDCWLANNLIKQTKSKNFNQQKRKMKKENIITIKIKTIDSSNRISSRFEWTTNPNNSIEENTAPTKFKNQTNQHQGKLFYPLILHARTLHPCHISHNAPPHLHLHTTQYKTTKSNETKKHKNKASMKRRRTKHSFIYWKVKSISHTSFKTV